MTHEITLAPKTTTRRPRGRLKGEAMSFVFCIATLLAGTTSGKVSGSLQDPAKKWSVELGAPYASTPLVYPAATPDSLVFATGGYVARLDGSGKIIFRVALGPELGRGAMFPASIGDVDGDSVEEIIAGRNDGVVFALEPTDGRVLWECQLPERLTNYEWAAAADLDGDGRAEVVVTTMYGWVFAVDDSGKLLWGAKIEAYRPSAPEIADIDSDGEPEIVYGTATRYLIALDSRGRLEWASFQPPHHLGRTTPLVADADGDGHAEVYGMSSMLSPEKGLVCVNGVDGSLKWHGLTIGKAYGGRALTRFGDGAAGILSCDKGGNIHAQNPDGSLRWHNRLSGSGVYNPPVTADVDGDGAFEIVATVRDTSTDGKGNNWYVLNASTGALRGAWQHPSRGIMGAAALDIDRDKELEVVICSKEGIVTAYSFGGAATPQATVFRHARERTFPLRVAGSGVKAKASADVPTVRLAGQVAAPRFGKNSLPVTLPAGATDESAVELEVTAPGGYRSLQVFRAQGHKTELEWLALASGDYALSLRWLDLSTGRSLGAEHLRASLQSEGTLRRIAETTVNRLRDLSARLDDAELTLLLKAAELEARFSALFSSIDSVRDEPLARKIEVAESAQSCVVDARRGAQVAAFFEREHAAGRSPKVVCWQDSNPWDNVSPHDELPEQGEPLRIDTWALGNEKESVCVNLLNVSATPVTLRVDPGTIAGEGTLPSVSEVATLHRVLWLPTVDGEQVADLLPRLGDGYLLDLAPGEARQLWINLSTRSLAPGAYELNWPVRTLDLDAATIQILVRLEVSPVSLPEKSRFYSGYWSQNRFGDFSSVPDLNDHLQTFWDRVPALPIAKVDARGHLIGELDWSAWDAFLSEVQQHGVIRLHHVPVPAFPDGLRISEELKLEAQRNYVQAWMAHMAKFGLGYRDFAFYVEDETGLRGTHENFMRGAKHIKEIDPKLQVYANPWGAITKAMLRDMAPVTDVWQPGMEVIEYHGPEVVDIMRSGGDDLISMYTPPGNCRTLLPLGFFRSQPWLALHWGIEGGGWWVYRQDDLFSTGPRGDPSYGGVNWDGRKIVWSRRWQAMRDGIEDFNAVVMLRELAEAKSDAAARTIVDEAIAYVASECITGMPREAADYDMDFATLMMHRQRIRAALERLSDR